VTHGPDSIFCAPSLTHAGSTIINLTHQSGNHKSQFTNTMPTESGSEGQTSDIATKSHLFTRRDESEETLVEPSISSHGDPPAMTTFPLGGRQSTNNQQRASTNNFPSPLKQPATLSPSKPSKTKRIAEKVVRAFAVEPMMGDKGYQSSSQRVPAAAT
jgi:hypothetical protein